MTQAHPQKPDDDDDVLISAIANAARHCQTGPRDFESKLKELQNTPLFMTHLPKDPQNNPAFEAIQALVYDGSPQEVATNFKNQGNEAYSERRFKDARVFYTKGLETQCDHVGLMATLHVNRAAAHLELGNHRQALADCAAALKLSPANVKALFRSARACMALERYADAVDCIERALEIDPTNDALKRELERAEQKRLVSLKELEKRKAKRSDEDAKERALQQALKARNIRFIGTKPPHLDNHHIRLDPGTNTLFIPTIFLYPEHATSDFISAFNETDTLDDHLHTVFDTRAEWDTAHEYTPDRLSVFFETRDSDAKVTLVRVQHDTTLQDCFRHPGFRIVDGVASFIVLVAGTPFARAFIERYTNAP
ncbi:hypothetical protein SeMB42_g03936 [Synchytrium endobioticum]|uniref:Cns1/TTC4 wheel domain-containing protein n=1 Tax=Synchytrium endobioticum TaxID=286115 RepID=A0A507D2A9_9FUNG|nr:hypothetical protein SeLEV6574_g06754 [Synchytrium endobioticum]TPX45639.1 hypothetical protein SeMB42_g03936 [Synchytrium endobioticum]